MNRGWRNVVCCASGPSFTEAQAALVIEGRQRGICNVIVVNDNYLRVPNADALYAADGKWYGVHLNKGLRSFQGEMWTQDHAAAEKHGLRYVQFVLGIKPLAATDPRISGGRNSGLQAIMLARQFGATRFALVGYDCDGDSHWFGKHAHPLANGNSEAFVKHFNNVAGPLRDEGIQIFNCSPTTKLDCFPRVDLATTLAAFEDSLAHA